MINVFGNVRPETLDSVKLYLNDKKHKEPFVDFFSRKADVCTLEDDDTPMHKWYELITKYVTTDDAIVRCLIDEVVCAFTGWDMDTLLLQAAEEYKESFTEEKNEK